jgi:hypothetical protein
MFSTNFAILFFSIINQVILFSTTEESSHTSVTITGLEKA